MSWILLVLSSVLLYSISAILQKVLMKHDKSDSHAYAIVFQLLGATLLFLFALTQGFVFPPIQEYLLQYVLVGVLYGTGSYCLFQSFKYLQASEVTIFISVRSIVAIIAAVIFLEEVFSVQQAIGTALILTSIVLITERSRKTKLNKGMLYALGTAVCFGLAITNDAFLIGNANVYSFAAIAFLLPGIFLILINPKKLLLVTTVIRGGVFHKLLIMTIFYVASVLTFYLALSLNAPVSQAMPIQQATVITTVILAAIFLQERDKLLRKVLAAVLVFIGVFLMT